MSEEKWVPRISNWPPPDSEALGDLRMRPQEIQFQEALHIIEENHYAHTIDDDTLWIYQDGLWTREGEAYVRRAANKDIWEYASSAAKTNIIRHAKDMCRQQIHRADFDQRLELVPVLNGVIDISSNPYHLVEDSPDYLFTTRIGAKYDPDAKAEHFPEFLAQIMSEPDAQITMECIGYCLHRSFPFDVAWMGLGGGRNGKSTLLEVIKTFLGGEENVSHQPLQAFTSNRFSTARLFGKLANIFYDIPNKALQDTGLWKATSGGDTIDAEQKFKDPFSFKPYAKQFYSTNQLAPTEDISDAFMRRWRIIRFPNVFVDEELGEGEQRADPHIIDKLITPKELSGILNLALEALQNCMERGRIPRNQTIQELRDEWQREANPVIGFVDAYVEYNALCESEREKVYSAFIAYCSGNKVVPWSKTRFNKEFQTNTGALSVRSSDKSKGRPPVWKGVELLGQPKHTEQEQLTNNEQGTTKKQLTNTGGEKPINTESDHAKRICRAAETEKTQRSIIEETGLNGSQAMQIIRSLIKRGYLGQPSTETVKWNKEKGEP